MTRQILAVSADFEETKLAVMSAMLFPRNANYRAAYVLRNRWASSVDDGVEFVLSKSELQALLDLPSRAELSAAADAGVKHGCVAGDLLALIYEQAKAGKPEPSMRAALRRYKEWAIGKKYGDGDALKYSDMQVRKFFEEALPAAHLWAAHRLMKRIDDNGATYKAAFSRSELPVLLGWAKALQDFATDFVPLRTKPPKPIIDLEEMLAIPEQVAAVYPLLDCSSLP
jgi:hypothetical protein